MLDIKMGQCGIGQSLAVLFSKYLLTKSSLVLVLFQLMPTGQLEVPNEY